MSDGLRVVYMGTPDFAVAALEALVASRHEVVGVFTNPDRPSGRGKSLTASPVKQCAQSHGIDVAQPARFRGDESALEQFRRWNPDVAVVAAYGQILPQVALDVPRLGCVNIHASLLPKYRGAAPINWCIIRGETKSGVTTMQMEAGLDTGPMLLESAVDIGPLETAGELHDRLMQLGADLIVPTLDGLKDGTLRPRSQNEADSSYAPMMSKDTGRIDWTATAHDVVNLVRGVNPWPGAWTHFDDRRLKVHLCQQTAGDGPAGSVLVADERLVVACGTSAVEILQLQAPGGRAMDAAAFLRGTCVPVGATFE